MALVPILFLYRCRYTNNIRASVLKLLYIAQRGFLYQTMISMMMGWKDDYLVTLVEEYMNELSC